MHFTPPGVEGVSHPRRVDQGKKKNERRVELKGELTWDTVITLSFSKSSQRIHAFQGVTERTETSSSLKEKRGEEEKT